MKIKRFTPILPNIVIKYKTNVLRLSATNGSPSSANVTK